MNADAKNLYSENWILPMFKLICFGYFYIKIP